MIFSSMFSELGNNEWHAKKVVTSLSLPFFPQMRLFALRISITQLLKKSKSQSLPDPIVTSPFAGATTDVGDAYTPKYLAVNS